MELWKELPVYWQANHVDGRPPSRQDIDPAVDLPHLVANLLTAADYAGAETIILPLVGKSGETEMPLVGVFYDRRFDTIDRIDYLTVSYPSL
jgi:hypothetical protein